MLLLLLLISFILILFILLQVLGTGPARYTDGVKRWPLRILICLMFLTGGAITTVAVAWGLTLRDTIEPSYVKHLSHHDGKQWQVDVSTRIGETSVSRVPNNGEWGGGKSGPPRVAPDAIPYWSVARDRPPNVVFADPTLPWHIEYALGWPFRSARAEVRTVVRATSGQHIPRNVWVATSGFEIVQDNPANRIPFYRVLPVQPIWPGFLINTLFYAAIWFGVFFAPGSAKRFIRIKRGRCPRCGYDLRGGGMSDKRLAMSGDALSTQNSAPSTSRGCPECGWNREGSDSSRRDDGM